MRKIVFDKVFLVLFFVSLIGFIFATIVYINIFNIQNYIRMNIFTLDMAICAVMYWNEKIKKELIEIQRRIDKNIETYKKSS